MPPTISLNRSVFAREASLPHFAIEHIGLPDEQLWPAQQAPEEACYFRLIWITGGEGCLWIDMNSYSIGANDVFFISPGQVYWMDSLARRERVGRAAEGYIISFTVSFLSMDDEISGADCSSGFLHFFSRQVVCLRSAPVDDTREILERMVKELRQANLFRVEILKRYFKIFLFYMVRLLEDHHDAVLPSRNLELVQGFMGFLEKDYIDHKMVSDYARKLFVTPNYLNQIVKKITGQSAGYHIRQRVMLEAKRKAVYSNKSMKEIAYLLGFSDPAHFSRLFKKTTGINFVDYRRSPLPIPCVREI